MGFSVLMSVYFKENPKYLEQALESIICQTLVPDEIILIEDGPLTKELYKIIELKKDKFPNLKPYQLKKNVQLGMALAKGVTLCKNEIIARMDSDDISVKNRFEIQYNYMVKHPDIAVTGGYIEEFNDNDICYHKIKKMPQKMPSIRKYAKYRNPLNHMTVMFRKSKVLEAGNYKHFPYLEDYNLWCRMLSIGDKFYNIPYVLVKSRISNQLYSRRGGFKYCLNYLRLRRMQKFYHLLSMREYIIAIFITIGMTLQPSTLRQFVYQKILRK